uniref:Transmembrane protein n=3 Tax=Opuntia streptacantha TaxID=393608 RepID=A0A7C9DAP2_OPUST
MAAKIALSSSLTPKLALLHNNLHPISASQLHSSSKTSSSHFRINAKLGGSDAEPKKGGKRKFITKEEEPEQYWQTAGEREGENPMSTPLPYILIFGMSTPFIILAIAFANGWIKVPVR